MSAPAAAIAPVKSVPAPAKSRRSRSIFTPEEELTLKDAFFRGFTNTEVTVALAICNQMNLSPFLKQVHFVKRYDRKLERDILTPQTGIDGFRLIAARSGAYAGSDEAVFEYAPNDPQRAYPKKATVTVWKIVHGLRVAFTAPAHWNEFYPGGKEGFMWDDMPHVMLAKCAEAQALRKGFPAELSGLYIDEEMHQADSPRNRTAAINSKLEKEVASEVSNAPNEEKKTSKAKGKKSDQPQGPDHCGKPMRVSQFVNQKFGHKPWWCPECNHQEAREEVKEPA